MAYNANTPLAHMAAAEEDAQEAIRLAGMAVASSPGRVGRNPHVLMSRAEVAAHPGDRAAAVRILRDACRVGLPRGSYVFTGWDLTPPYGYRPFADLVRPKG